MAKLGKKIRKRRSSMERREKFPKRKNFNQNRKK
jgi:hypothetical protein